MPFLSKKKSLLSTLSMLSLATQALEKRLDCKLFAKFDEKKDYVKRCMLKHPLLLRLVPCLVLFCVGKKL